MRESSISDVQARRTENLESPKTEWCSPHSRSNRTVLYSRDLRNLLWVLPLPKQTRHEQDTTTRDRDRTPSRQDPVFDHFRSGVSAGSLEGYGETEVIAVSCDEGIEVGRGS